MDHSGRLGSIFRQIENIEEHGDESSVVLKGMLDMIIERCQQAKATLDAADTAKLQALVPASPEIQDEHPAYEGQLSEPEAVAAQAEA